MTLQHNSEAKFNTLLVHRFSAHLLAIADDIFNEPPATDHHYMRLLIVNSNDEFRGKVAKQMLGIALSQNALTLPVTDDGAGTQTQPTDAEIENSVNAYMATPVVLYEILDNLIL